MDREWQKCAERRMKAWADIALGDFLDVETERIRIMVVTPGNSLADASSAKYVHERVGI